MPVFRKNGRNILFIHVPKCGGTSVENAFRQSGYRSLYLDGKTGPGTVNYFRPCTPQHMHAEILEKIFLIDRFDAVFMLVREPLARFRSEFVYRHRKRNFAGVAPSAEYVSSWAAKALDSHASDPFHFDNHLRPQHEFQTRNAEVYKLEDGLDNVFNDLNRRFELGLSVPLERGKDGRNSGLMSSQVELEPRLVGRLQELYKYDYTSFGYAK
ncbi:sulfotransferase family 2 domain-containing protein [Microbacterium sp. KR10-403]|uniref:sulfotransferase family 2 domain-containing protein n=1 Tax=Microbacterium sp. KR10-403 TaxID=3158581 RepID=UPI0032E3A272